MEENIKGNDRIKFYESALNIWDSEDKTSVCNYYVYGEAGAKTDLKVHKFKRSKEYQNLESHLRFFLVQEDFLILRFSDNLDLVSGINLQQDFSLD